jgi:hypothetical protein
MSTTHSLFTNIPWQEFRRVSRNIFGWRQAFLEAGSQQLETDQCNTVR